MNSIIDKIKQTDNEIGTQLVMAWEVGSFGYEPYKNKNQFPEVPAVYIALNDNQVIYIGKTNNLKRRFYQHHRDEIFTKSEAFIFWFELDQSILFNAEKLCISVLNPQLNYKESQAGSSGTKPNTTMILSADELVFIQAHYSGEKSRAIHDGLKLLMDNRQP